MKIVFDDNSLLEIVQSESDDDKVSLIVCGWKGHNQTTMSTAELDAKQVYEIVEFLSEWLNKKIE